jgi:hypothetical protein
MFYVISLYLWTLAQIGVESGLCAGEYIYPACNTEQSSPLPPPPPPAVDNDASPRSFISNGF